MARRRVTAKQRAASRRNIRKAQIVSARKRRGTGKKTVRRTAVRRGPIARTAVSRKSVRLPGEVRRITANRVSRVQSRPRTPTVRSHYARNRKRYKAVGYGLAGATALAGSGMYARDLNKNVRLYHNTDKRYVAGIRNSGLQGVKVGSFSHVRFREEPGMVFVAKGMNTTKMFGDHVVKVKMDRKYFNAHARPDRNMPRATRAYQIHESHLRPRKGVKYSYRRGGPMQKAMYRQMFPGGTKESYKG